MYESLTDPSNPYSAPAAQIDELEPAKAKLASVGNRILARIIDLILFMVTSIVFYVVAIFFGVFALFSIIQSNEMVNMEDLEDSAQFEENFENLEDLMIEWSAPTNFNIGNPFAYAILVISQLTFLTLNAFLLARRGQTIGKRLMNIRMIDKDTKEKPPFGRLYFLRYFIFEALLIFSFMIYYVFKLIDLLFLFRKDRRTIHDMTANTIVVNC